MLLKIIRKPTEKRQYYVFNGVHNTEVTRLLKVHLSISVKHNASFDKVRIGPLFMFECLNV